MDVIVGMVQKVQQQVVVHVRITMEWPIGNISIGGKNKPIQNELFLLKCNHENIKFIKSQ